MFSPRHAHAPVRPAPAPPAPLLPSPRVPLKSAVSLMKTVVEKGPWMEAMGEGMRRATAGDFEGALVLYSRLAEVR